MEMAISLYNEAESGAMCVLFIYINAKNNQLYNEKASFLHTDYIIHFYESCTIQGFSLYKYREKQIANCLSNSE